MTQSPPGDIYGEAMRRRATEQAKALRKQASAGGLRFEAYLPSSLAEWLLDQIENGTFIDPGEAVFVMLTEQRDLEPHTDLREEIVRRSCQEAMDDPSPRIPHGEAMAWLQSRMEEPQSETAIWKKES